MKWALVIVLVVAVAVLLFYVARSKAETLPAQPAEPTPPPAPAPTLSAAPPVVEVTRTLERTAEENWRARIIIAAQAYERAAETYANRFPSYRPARNALIGARALNAAAATESRASLMFRVAFASAPPAGANAARRAYDELVTAIRAPIDFQPALAVVPTVTGIVPLGDLHL